MGIFDAHFHIIDPHFPLIRNQGYLPSNYPVENYRAKARELGITGGSLVSGSFQGFDQSYLLNALAKLGPDFFGVANIPADYSVEELRKLDAAGVRAVRFNLKRGGSAGLEHMVRLSNELHHAFGWRTELYVENKDLSALRPHLHQLPAFSIDHLGITKAGLDDLYYWVERGARVKATGFGRIDFDPLPVMRTIYARNPGALMFGTDLPSTRAGRPFAAEDLVLIKNHFSQEAQRRILWENGWGWYGLEGRA